MAPRELLRQKGTPYQELGLDAAHWTDDQLVDAMLAHPILINRPIVVTALGAKLCRPSEAVLELLPVGPLAPFVKEDGEVVRDRASVDWPLERLRGDPCLMGVKPAPMRPDDHG